ncbi:MFS transporter [Pseudomonas helleri]|uniref:MFS transporter n=1 Tax=Pseudomonas helleri TaxID=1608996 RepID=UPI0033427A95
MLDQNIIEAAHKACEAQRTTPHVDLQSAERERVFAKVKRHIIPIAILGLFVAFIDRTNLSVAGHSMSDSLSLSPAAFGLAAGLFYLGYILTEVPSNIALKRYGARRWIARIMISWGAITVLTMFVNTAESLYIARFLLGIAEAGFYPGILFWMSFWLPSRSLTRAYSLFQLGIPISLAIGSLVTAQLLRLDGVGGLHGWQWVFLIEGGAAVVMGLFTLKYMADKPSDAKWLSVEEKQLISDALSEEEVAEPENEKGHGHALKEVFTSGAAWAYALCFLFMMIGFWTVTYWLPQILQERLQVDSVRAGVLSAVPWVISGLSLLIVSKRVEKGGSLAGSLVGVLLFCAIGFAMSSLAGSALVAFIGLCMAACIQAAVPLLFSFPSRHFNGARAAVALAMVNSVGSLGGFIGPVLLGWMKEATGSNQAGLLAMAGAFVLAALLAAILPKILQSAKAKP